MTCDKTVFIYYQLLFFAGQNTYFYFVAKIIDEYWWIVEGEAVQYQEACSDGLVEISLGPGVMPSQVISSVALTDKYQGVEWTNIQVNNTLATERKEITGKLSKNFLSKI